MSRSIRSMALAVALVVSAGAVLFTASTLISASDSPAISAPNDSDSLDPNDCSRGIDESNQENCADGVQS